MRWFVYWAILITALWLGRFWLAHLMARALNPISLRRPSLRRLAQRLAQYAAR